MKALDLKGQKDLQDQYTSQSTALESSRGNLSLFVCSPLTFCFSDSKHGPNSHGQVRSRKVATENSDGGGRRTQKSNQLK